MLEGQLRPGRRQRCVPLGEELTPSPLERVALHLGLSVGIHGTGLDFFVGKIQKLVGVVAQKRGQ